MDSQTYLLQQTPNKQLEEQLQTNQSVLYLGLQGAAKSLLAATLYDQMTERKLVIVAADSIQAEQYIDDLASLSPDTPLYLYNVPDSVAADWAIASPEALSEQIEALDFLQNDQAEGICVIPLLGLKKRVTPPEIWRNLSQTYQLNDEVAARDLLANLLAMGYERVSMTMKPGEVSLRGDIIDVYPLTADGPMRISLGFDEVERITSIDPETQKSIEDKKSIHIIPAHTFTYSKSTLQEKAPQLVDQITPLLNQADDDAVKKQMLSVIENEAAAWANGEETQWTRYLQSYIYDETATIVDYLKEDVVMVIDDYARLVENELLLENNVQTHLQSLADSGHLPKQLSLYENAREQLNQFTGRQFYLATLQKGLGHLTFDALYQFHTRPVTNFFEQSEVIKVEFEAWQRTKRTVVVWLKDNAQVRHFQNQLRDLDIQSEATAIDQIFPQKINLVVGGLSSSIEFVQEKVVHLASQDIFKEKKRRRRRQPKLSNAERLKNYQELEPGDYVVHVNHGIGRFVGLDTITIDGIHNDYLSIMFADNASIHVPIDQLHLIQKYVSSEGKEPKLHKMGGTKWAKTKQKVSSKVEDIADELIDLYAERQAQKGYAFSEDTPEQAEFEAAFPYTETEDQVQSIQEMKQDMEKEQPMDRLLVGDVGFGKTEVAMRGIFKALMDGKQTAFLVPTTVLAQQHYETLIERFADFPFHIELLSRFRTKAQQKEAIDGLAKGKVDIIVGTHRLLSKDVKFLDLGLLIVDEEQRFGVKDKERLKALKENVDVLTLTATPIPRTLNMSMLGVRDLSVIETPPANRFPVQTFVMEQHYGAITDAISREIMRGGQVFYLFNNVRDIEKKASELQDLVPDARIGIAHGQMTVLQLETVMMAFVEGEYDVLVTTTIIETGVDIPNANTLIVENADRMGLSTLYQLRGRVGRSSRVAYAYFMYRPERMLSEVSEKRLAALRDFTELGSGFKIAMRDLSIRGAGNLLGKQQHGFVDSVGFDLYSQMLNEAVARKQGKKPQEKPQDVEIDLQVDAYIPESYIADSKQKIEIYKRVNTITDQDAMWDLDDELMDRFGEPPVEVQLLLQVGAIKSYAQNTRAIMIKRVRKNIAITFTSGIDQSVWTPAIFEALEDIPLQLQIKEVDGQLQMNLGIKQRQTEEWLDDILQFFSRFNRLIKKQGLAINSEEDDREDNEGDEA